VKRLSLLSLLSRGARLLRPCRSDFLIRTTLVLRFLVVAVFLVRFIFTLVGGSAIGLFDDFSDT
jgi:hypothetical protein